MRKHTQTTTSPPVPTLYRIDGLFIVVCCWVDVVMLWSSLIAHCSLLIAHCSLLIGHWSSDWSVLDWVGLEATEFLPTSGVDTATTLLLPQAALFCVVRLFCVWSTHSTRLHARSLREWQMSADVDSIHCQCVRWSVFRSFVCFRGDHLR